MFYVLHIKDLFIKHVFFVFLHGTTDQCGPRSLTFRVSESHLQVSGRTTLTDDHPIARPLPTRDKKEAQKNANMHLCPVLNSNPRS
jgi:hypothetical protein